jgi:predicted  nucleic acid-binding Zn-ribbon protein
VDALPPLGAAGIAALLAIVIGYLLNANRQDRKEHRTERQEWDARFKAQQESHARDMKDLRGRLDTLEEEARQRERELRDETLRADRAEARLIALSGGTGT